MTQGLIVYSSKTGNTKNMAQAIYQALKDEYTMTLADIKDKPKTSSYDFILLGAWVDRGSLEGRALKFYKKIENKNIGLFATLGALPDSEHGQKVYQNLEELLAGKNSLGSYLCPGLVDPKMIKVLQGLTGMAVPKDVKEKMIDTSLKSRKATHEELQAAGEYFKNQIKANLTN